MSVRHALLMIALLAAGAGAPACGGGGEPASDREQVTEVVEGFNDAFSSGDYDRACDLMHSRRRQQLEYGRGQSCADILADSAQSTKPLVDALANARITSVAIDGDYAIVGVEGRSLGSRQAMLDRDGDRGWRLSESAAGL
jgi:hypothetical protein